MGRKKAKQVRVHTACAGGQTTAVTMSIDSSPYLVASEKTRSKARNNARGRLLNAYLSARQCQNGESRPSRSKREGAPLDTLWLSGSDSAMRDALRLLGPTQRIARFPGAIKVSEKIAFSALVERCSQLWPKRFDFVPRTWTLPCQLSDVTDVLNSNNLGRTARVAARKRREAGEPPIPVDPSLPPKTRTFIVKPSRGLQGRGIYLAQRPTDLQMCPLAPGGAAVSHGAAVVQDYVDDPLTIEGRKFDLRLYMLLRSVDPPVAYLCDHGMVRLCAEVYEKPKRKNLADACMHLTNYAVNKKHANFDGGGNGGAADASAAGAAGAAAREGASVSAAGGAPEPQEDDGAEETDCAEAPEEEAAARDNVADDDDDGSTGCKRTLAWLWEHLTSTHGAAAVAKLQKRLQEITHLTAMAVAPPLACLYRQTVHEADINAMADDVAVATLKTNARGNPWEMWKQILASKKFAQHSARVAKHGGVDPNGSRGQKSRCFQIFGLDVMLDQDLNPWLLELNARPSLSLLRPGAAAAVVDGGATAGATEESSSAAAPPSPPSAAQLSAVDVAIKVPMLAGALHIANSFKVGKIAQKARGLGGAKGGRGGAKIAPSGGAGAVGADADTEAWKRVDSGGVAGPADVAAAAAAVVTVAKAKPNERLDLLLRCCNLFFHAVQDNVATGAAPGLSGATLRAVAPPPSSTGLTPRPRRPGGSGSGIEPPPGLLGRESFCRFVRRTGIFDGLSVKEGGGGLLAHRVDLVWMEWCRRSDVARALGIGCPTARTQGVTGLDPLAFCDFLIDTAKVKFPGAASVAEALELVLQHCNDASAAALAAKGSGSSG